MKTIKNNWKVALIVAVGIITIIFVRCVLYTEFPEQSIYLGRAS